MMKTIIKIDDWMFETFQDIKKELDNNPEIAKRTSIKLDKLTPEAVFAIGLNNIKSIIAMQKATLISEETGNDSEETGNDVEVKVELCGGRRDFKIKITDGSN